MLRLQVPLERAIQPEPNPAPRSSHARPSAPTPWPCRPRPRPDGGRPPRPHPVTTAPSGLEGEGFPRAPGLRGPGSPRPRPVRAHGPDGRGRLRPGRAQGHPPGTPTAGSRPSPHDRRGLEAAGLQWGRRVHYRRRHAVDDSRRRDPPHRGATRGGGDAGRAVPRLPALGSTCRPGSGPPLPGHPRRGGEAAELARQRGPAAGDRRRDRRYQDPASPTPRSRCCATWPPAPAWSCPGGPTNALVYVLAGSGSVRPGATRCARASWPSTAPATVSPGRRHHQGEPPPAARRAGPGRPADPRAGGRLRPLRDEHPRRGSSRPSRATRPAASAPSRPSPAPGTRSSARPPPSRRPPATAGRRRR